MYYFPMNIFTKDLVLQPKHLLFKKHSQQNYCISKAILIFPSSSPQLFLLIKKTVSGS